MKTFTCALVFALLAALAVPAAGRLAFSTNLVGTVTGMSNAIIPRADVRTVTTVA